MKSRNPTEDDLKAYEANMKKIKLSRDGVKEHTGSGAGGGRTTTERPARGTTVKSSARTSHATIQTFFVATILPNLNDMIEAAKSRQGNWSKYAEEKVLYQSLIKKDIKAFNLRPMGRISVHFLWHEKNKRRDKDNICAAQKYILDALVEQQILVNDGWDEIAGIHHAWVVAPELPGCRVTLEEVP